jgi:hypothetical protein
MATYKYEEIFQENPDNPDEVLMTIPEEILEAQGWVEGDKLKIVLSDDNTYISISKVED